MQYYLIFFQNDSVLIIDGTPVKESELEGSILAADSPDLYMTPPSQSKKLSMIIADSGNNTPQISSSIDGGNEVYVSESPAQNDFSNLETSRLLEALREEDRQARQQLFGNRDEKSENDGQILELGKNTEQQNRTNCNELTDSAIISPENIFSETPVLAASHRGVWKTSSSSNKNTTLSTTPASGPSHESILDSSKRDRGDGDEGDTPIRFHKRRGNRRAVIESDSDSDDDVCDNNSVAGLQYIHSGSTNLVAVDDDVNTYTCRDTQSSINHESVKDGDSVVDSHNGNTSLNSNVPG